MKSRILLAFALLLAVALFPGPAFAQSPAQPAETKIASAAAAEPTILTEEDTIVIESALAAQKAVEELLTNLFKLTFAKYGKDPRLFALSPMPNRRNLWSFQQREEPKAVEKPAENK